MKPVLGLLLGALLWSGCGGPVLRRPPPGVTIPPGALLAALEEYNAGPESVRVQGRLAAGPGPRAVFAARASRVEGFRLDAVAGPFSSPLLAMSCRRTGACEIYLPRDELLLLDPEGVWNAWLGDLLRGRVPLLGTANGARSTAAGEGVLTLHGRDGWVQEVVFPGGGRYPDRVVLSRFDRARLEIRYEEYTIRADHPFPTRIRVRVHKPAAEYEFTFEKVNPEEPFPGQVLTLSVPAGTPVEILQGGADWDRTDLPLWLLPPDG